MSPRERPPLSGRLELLAGDLLQDWLNGNRTDVLERLEQMRSARAAAVGLIIGSDETVSADVKEDLTAAITKRLERSLS